MTTNNSDIRSVFHPHEHAFIADWIGVNPPEGTPELNTFELDDDSLEGVGLLSDTSGDVSEYTVSNAVARLVLGAIEHRLPQWAAFYEDGRILYARKYSEHPTHQHRLIATIPQYLFTINWAESGPGYNWPEAYYVTWLPYYDVFVVTASQDSPDVHGYTDEAIGCFSKEKDLVEGSAEIIRDQWWQGQYDEYGQQEWAYLFGTGLIDEATAYEWASKVWKDTEEEDTEIPEDEDDEPGYNPDALLLDEPITKAVSLEEREQILIGMVEQGGDPELALKILGLRVNTDPDNGQRTYVITESTPPILEETGLGARAYKKRESGYFAIKQTNVNPLFPDPEIDAEGC